MTLNAASVPDPANPHLSIFNTEAFYALRGMAWRPLDLFAAGARVGTLALTDPVEGWVLNGRYAPWGGVDWENERLPPEGVAEALAAVPFISATAMEIRCAPPHMSLASSATIVGLVQLGFEAKLADLSYWIEMPEGVNDYVRGLKHEARVALERTREDLRVGWVQRDDDSHWREGYALLDANRRAKGRKMSFDVGYLLKLRDAFPGLIRMALAVDHQQRLRAAALVYRVAWGRDYVQAWGHDASIKGRSPMNVLAREVVAESIRTGARSLNLGKTSNDGVPDSGLARFKRSIGAVPEVLWTVTR